MLVAYVAMAGNATLIKKIGGPVNTRIHGYLMSSAAAIALFGWYVIYTNKDMYGKPHNTTVHAWCGIICLVGYASIGPFAYFALSPDWGFLRTNQTVRAGHKYGGRVLTALAWVTCLLGWMTMQADPLQRALFGLPLLPLAYYCLL
mmetsp:Transcript_32203/g.85911  ORF Transcript_32203/g.85911 Transcript_32203/m.85911 type:complete len:146 (+) Transcript_32203:341-778(+)